MSGTGATPAVRPKGRSAGSRAAFGYPPLALGQTALAAQDEVFGTNMRTSSLRAAVPTHSTRLTAQGEGYEAATAIQVVP
jgi:hypothetical protein